MGVRYFCDRCEKEFKSEGLAIETYARDALGTKLFYMGVGLLCEGCAKKFNMVKDRLKYEEDFFDMSDEDFYTMTKEENVTIQDAINHFKYGISHDIFSEPVTTYAEMAIEALEKQIASKTVIRDYVPNGTLIYGYCPKCKTFTDNNEEHCYKCGQKLDWN